MRCYDWQEACRQPGTVTELYLMEQGWSQIPPELSQFTALRVLDLSGNHLQELPALLGKLPQLQRLILARNALFEWSPVLNRLPNLQELDLSHNRLQQLDWNGTGLAQLRQLHLHHNHLKSLQLRAPLPGLQRLNLSQNRLADFTEGGENLPQLSSLLLRGNRLVEWCPSTGYPRLQLLDLGRNRLQALPPLLTTSQFLRHLRLDYNRLTDLPSWIWQLPWLTELDLANNLLRQLTSPLGMGATRLEKLNLAYNQIEQLGPLPLTLRWLSLGRNRLGAVPSALGSLDQIRHLDLSGNPLGAASLNLPANWALDFLGLGGAAPVDLAQTALSWKKLVALRGGMAAGPRKVLLKLVRWGEKWERSGREKWACFQAWQEQSTAPLAELSTTTLILLENCGIPTLVQLARQKWSNFGGVPAPGHDLPPGTQLVFLGRPAESWTSLVKRLERQGITLARTPQEGPTTLLVLGKPPVSLELLAGWPVSSWQGLTEGQVLQWLAQKERAFLLQINPVLLEKIKLLLLHQDSNNVQLGLNLLETGGVPTAVLPLLLIAYLWQPPQSPLRKQALRLLQLHWPQPFATIVHQKIQLPRDPQQGAFQERLGQILTDAGLPYPDLGPPSPPPGTRT